MKVLRLILPTALISAVALMMSCSQQGEGERCDRRAGNNGSDDCASGLVCADRTNLNGATGIPTDSTEGRCCPANRATATERICQQTNGGIGSDSGTPDAVGAVEDSGSDATTDTSDSATLPDANTVVDADDAG